MNTNLTSVKHLDLYYDIHEHFLLDPVQEVSVEDIVFCHLGTLNLNANDSLDRLTRAADVVFLESGFIHTFSYTSD